jgi:DNA-nicking Smr family endonuclease
MQSKADSDRAEPVGALWRRAMRDVKQLAARPVPPRLKPASAPAAVPRPASPPAKVAPTLPPLALDRPAGIDRANAERLKRGKHAVEARLDLHGMTQDEAHRRLGSFIRAARADGRRCVLVITGRGRVGGGILRAAVPRWLDEPELRPHVLAIATAQPRDGGAGALYVMLRRTRTG